jgi:hypothetical protein
MGRIDPPHHFQKIFFRYLKYAARYMQIPFAVKLLGFTMRRWSSGCPVMFDPSECKKALCSRIRHDLFMR